jgi:hypothetical protein
MKELNKTAHNFSVSLLIALFYYIIFLNKKESEVILHARI